MARFPRVYMDNALYYVTAETEAGKALFCDSADYDRYLELIRGSRKKYRFKLFAFALLPTGVQLLIEPRDSVNISTIMHSLNSHYTKQYNSRYQKKGHVFTGRYKAILVEKNRENLLKLIKYIHLTPQRMGLTDDLRGYTYSSYKSYLVPTGISTAINIEDEIREVSVYVDKTESGYLNKDDRDVEELTRLLYRRAYMGSPAFINNVYNKLKVQKQERIRMIRRPYKRFIMAGSILVILLIAGGIYYYNERTGLQVEASILQTSIEMAKQELDKRYAMLKQEVRFIGEEKTRQQLNGSEWEIRLTPASGEAQGEPKIDRVAFRDGIFISDLLASDGYPISYYSVTVEKDGTVVWETLQTKPDGTTASWYGIWSGDVMKGVLSERYVQGGNRDFSFVSTNKI